MKIAYTGWTWLVNHKDNQRFELEQAIKECKYLGYDYVENFAFICDFYEDPAELKALLKKYDVEMVNLYGHFKDDPEKDYATCVKQIDFMEQIGATFFNCQGSCWGEPPFDRPLNKETVMMYAELCNRLGAYAKAKGIQLCFHPHANSAVFAEDQIDYFVENTDPAVVGLCLDTAHTTIAGMDAPKAFAKYIDRITYVHLKDVAPNDMDGPGGKMASFRALGLGTVDFVGCLNALRAGGYDGVMCVELDRPEVCNYNSAEISRKYIRNALKL
jgi:inosose dehydratase